MTRTSRARRLLLVLPLLAGSSAARSPQERDVELARRARELSLELCQSPRLAGTIGSLHGARIVARHLRAAGFEVELDAREVLLSLPRRLALAAFEDVSSETAWHTQIEHFDPDAIPPGDVPPFNAWSASGKVRAPVVDVGHGLRADYERLTAAGVDVKGAIALARYGRAYRGVKVDLAEEFGCVGVLLYASTESEGAGRGSVWPLGPWKTGREAQRGSISAMSQAPGDPSTPGTPSPAPGEPVPARLSTTHADAVLPRIPCLPIGGVLAAQLLSRLAPRTVAAGDAAQPIGPGPVVVELDLDVPRELRTIHNVIATLPGRSEGLVLAGSHRDAWVRGAQDSGSGCVALLLAAEELGARARAGWRPQHTLQLAFWDGEESGLIGSTEFGEAHAASLRERGLVYVNADAIVSGTRISISGAPGMLGFLGSVLAGVPPALQDAPQPGASLWQQLHEGTSESPRLGLPGSGSDFAVFLHHLGVPVLELSFGGNSGGQYHTAFDDFDVMDRFLDPGWRGHALAGRTHAVLLAALADTPGAGFDAAEAAGTLAVHARELNSADETWFGAQRAERLGAAFDALAQSLRESRGSAPGAPENGFYRALERSAGLAGRPWFRNALWTAGLETGYSSETFPILRSAARTGPAELDRELELLVQALERLAPRESAPAAASAR